MRYLTWLAGAVHGDFGVSWRYGQPVLTLVGRAFFVTLEIGLLTLFLATLVGVPLGVLAAINEGRATDYIIQSFNVLALSAPVFWVAMMLLFAVSATFGWSPPIVYVPLSQSLTANIEMMWLPVVSLSLLQAAAYSQFVRQVVVGAKRQAYVRTAIAKGLPEWRVNTQHVGRNVLLPVVTPPG